MIRRRVACCALAALTALTACTGGTGGADAFRGEAGAGHSPTARTNPSDLRTPSGTRAGSPVVRPQRPDPPQEGSCYRLTLEDAARPTSDRRPVECTRPHTARTIHVGRLDTVVRGHALGVDSARVQQQLAGTCPRQLSRFLGGQAQTRALSRFESIWFSPSLGDYAAGADWFRCDVVAVAGPARLLDLPSGHRLRGILDRPGALATYGLCGTAQPGADGFERVACARPHTWVAISIIPIPGGDRYPGVAAVREGGDEQCSREVRGRNDYVLEYSYGWEWPTAEQWAEGQRYGYCWAPEDLA